MPQTINTNIMSLNAQRNLDMSRNSLAQAVQRLSSGLRVNSAKDDAAGLAIAERFTSQIRGLNQAARNANDGISLAQTGEGALGSMASMLQRIRELAVQAANASNSPSDRQALNNEVSQLTSELDRVSRDTQFNGQPLFDGSFGTATFQIGANAGQSIIASTANFRTTMYGNNQVVSAGVGPSNDKTNNGVLGDKLDVNGAIGSKQITIADKDSAATIAAKINEQSPNTGVNAEARTDAAVAFAAAGAYQIAIKSNNATPTTISFTITAATGTSGLSTAISAINEQSAKTGVTAKMSADNTRIILTNPSGQDIQLSDTAVVNGGAITVDKVDNKEANVGTAITLNADTTADDSLVSGYVTMDSQASFGITANGALNAFTTGTSTLYSVSTLDITTYDSATNALKIVDSALAAVAGQRSKFGALQARFENAINGLNITSENMAASRSRIQDADFAAETAALSRAQVLQQAGTAMVAQANQLPQQVLSLLKG